MDDKFEKDMEILREHSDYAKKYAFYTTMTIDGDECRLCDYDVRILNPDSSIRLLDVFGWCITGEYLDDAFHPNNAGCIELFDDYFFGIRCDHLVWIDYNDFQSYHTLLIGNHKGITYFRVITYKKNYSEYA